MGKARTGKGKKKTDTAREKNKVRLRNQFGVIVCKVQQTSGGSLSDCMAWIGPCCWRDVHAAPLVTLSCTTEYTQASET